MKIMTSEYDLERFHCYDGIRHHADASVFNVGDIVDVEQPLTGVDKNGNAYHLDASTFFTKNVVALMTTIDSAGNVTINDGTANSPIMVHGADNGSFSEANFINKMLFKPYTITSGVLEKVIDTTGNIANTVIDTASNTVSGVGSFLNGITKNLSWILVLIVVVGAIYAINKFKLI